MTTIKNRSGTNLAILTDLLSARQTPQISLLADLGRFFSLSHSLALLFVLLNGLFEGLVVHADLFNVLQ